jgi:hypothetical protein
MGKQYLRRPPGEAIDDILARPPLNDGELARRLRGVEKAGARRAIVERIEQGDVPPDDFDLLAAAMLHVGIGAEADRLEGLALDTSMPRPARWIAVSLLISAAAPARAERILNRLTASDRLRLMLQPAAEAARNVQAAPELDTVIADSISCAAPEDRDEAVGYLEEIRRGAGTPAVLAYRELIRREPPLPVLQVVLEAVVDDGGKQAAAELAILRDTVKNPPVRQAIQRALLRLGTRAIDPSRRSERSLVARGEGFLGSCDGQGAFLVAGCFENPDGTRSFASVCVRAGGDIRNAFIVPASTADERDSLLDGMRIEGFGGIAPISLAGAASLVLEALARTRASGRPIPDDAQTAALLFERAWSPAHRMDPLPAPAASVTPQKAKSLLKLPMYQCWFFDRGDLAAGGVELTSFRRGPQKAEWARDALEKLGRSEVRTRLIAMLEHMASWHALRGESELASLCAAAAHEAEQEIFHGALPRAMLERSLEALAHDETEGRIGNPSVRGRLRLEFFQEIEAPKGHDLATLDFCEAAYVALDGALSLLPASRRPRDGDTATAAFRLAVLFAAEVFSANRRPLVQLLELMEEALHAITRLDRGDCGSAVRAALNGLGAFVEQVCGRCPVACLHKPRSDMAEAFFSAEHPAKAAVARE